MSGIKIRMVEVNGVKRVPPKCMELLQRFASHRDECKQCYRAYYAQNPDAYCPAGLDILRELAAQPEVERHEGEENLT